MTQNNNELLELEQLKATYNKIDERLNGQEIVSDEQLRETMCGKFTDMRRSLKEGLIWSNLVLIPLFVWHWHTTGELNMLSLILLCVYWVASLIFKIFILKKTGKEDFGSYDLKTLTGKESQYNKNMTRATMVMVVFWFVYTVQWCLGKGKGGAAFLLAMILLVIMSIFLRKAIIRIKFNGQTINPETGKPRILEVKWLKYIFFGILGLCLICLLIGSVMPIIQNNDLAAYVNFFNYLPIIISAVAFILAILHFKKKITVSSKLIYALVAIAIILCIGMVALAKLTTIGITYSTGNILSTVCTASLAHSFFKMRK
jgi:preprotein translocase subunit SecG